MGKEGKHRRINTATEEDAYSGFSYRWTAIGNDVVCTIQLMLS